MCKSIRVMKQLKIFIILLILTQNIFSQKLSISFEHFKIEQGIPPFVPCILQDRTGYIWLGTYYGIYRYDGYSIVSYMPDESDTNSITNAVVEALCDDKEGNIWIGHAHGVDKFNPSTERFTHYILNKQTQLNEWSNHVLSILVDRNENLWVGTGDGLYLFDKKDENFKRIVHDSTDPGSLIQNAVNAIYESRDGTLWFGTGNGLDKLDMTNNKFIHYWSDTNFRGFSWAPMPHWILSIFEDHQGIIWLGTSGCLVEFNRKLNSFTLYKNNPKDPTSLANNAVNSICGDSNGFLWIGTQNGVDIFNKNSRKFSHYIYNENNPGSLSSNYVGKILYDKSGTTWVTTLGGGVNKYTPQNSSFKLYSSEIEGPAKLPNAILETLVEDNKGKIWIGSDKGLVSFDPLKEVFKEEPLKVNISSILVDYSGTLWISSWSTGNLFYKKENEGKINQFFESNGQVFYEAVSTMCNSSDGSIWLGTGDGKVLKLNPTERRVEQIAKYSTSIEAIYEDKSGLLWIGTHDAGIVRYNPKEKSFTRFSIDPKDSLTISGNEIMDFCEDGTGTFWIVASTSLNKFDREKQKCIWLGGKDGFPKDAFTITDDAHGNLYISTINGVIKYDPLTKKFNNYPNIKGSFGYKVKNGDLYFLSAPFYNEKQVIVRFNPDSLHNNAFIPPVVITTFKKFEKPFPFGKVIQLSHNENFISFEFSALSYIHPEKNQYAYKMEGIDKDWVYSGTRRYASYPNLTPGEYIFNVKASNNDGVWNETGTSIAIIISPPWWRTWWAYSSYAVIFIFSLYGVRRYELNRLRLKDKVKMDAAVLKEREETDIMKSRFFANISHEFRTPLTLIMGPAEKISLKTSDDIIKDANIIRRNSRRLLQLINQLLDLSKLEAGKLKLEASKGNIVSFVKGAALSFESLAESKDINLKISSEKDLIELHFDKEKMMKILTNIFSNAFKFTPEEGTISVSIKESFFNKRDISLPTSRHRNEKIGGYVEIKIRDTGIGIANEEIPKLFDRFYQVDSTLTREYEGTGIGLALTKELVELHHGSIKVESEKGSWTEFILEFPLGKDHLTEDEIIKEVKNIEPDIYTKSVTKETENVEPILNVMQEDVLQGEKTIVLVVEDNYDMRQYIKEALNNEYIVEEAINGEQGIRKAEKIIPDLIVSDMMMPKMDGNELVRILKNDEKTSHIPIILLTARAGYEDKLEGLETGADDYLTKPFDIKELQIRVKNLINIRKKLQEKFSKIEFKPVKEKKLNSLDEKFMIKVNEIIEKHIAEEEFNMEEFGEELNMSRMQVYRKLKALTGKSANRYVRSVKLERAKNMIEAKELNISEIAYSLGFGSPAYFTKCFKDEFGYPPRETVE